jgi:hydrogenase maturation factor HypF (carbamoyltransferase family)
MYVCVTRYATCTHVTSYTYVTSSTHMSHHHTHTCAVARGAVMPHIMNVTYVYDDVTYVYDDVTYVHDDVTCAVARGAVMPLARLRPLRPVCVDR